MPKHHLIISGTGRAGTTFLVQLLTELGLDTGFPNATSGIHESCNAGMEWNIKQPNAPYVVKNPALCKDLEEVLEAGNTVIDCAIIPIRDLYASAESRRTVQRKLNKKDALGGLILTKNPSEQENVLALQLHSLVHTLAKHDVPMIWLYFPRHVQDPEYLYSKIKSLLPGQTLETFMRAFRAVSRPELVHKFEQKEQPATPQKKPLLKGLKTLFRS
jgi:hypothetical protein